MSKLIINGGQFYRKIIFLIRHYVFIPNVVLPNYVYPDKVVIPNVVLPTPETPETRTFPSERTIRDTSDRRQCESG